MDEKIQRLAELVEKAAILYSLAERVSARKAEFPISVV